MSRRNGSPAPTSLSIPLSFFFAIFFFQPFICKCIGWEGFFFSPPHIHNSSVTTAKTNGCATTPCSALMAYTHTTCFHFSYAFVLPCSILLLFSFDLLSIHSFLFFFLLIIAVLLMLCFFFILIFLHSFFVNHSVTLFLSLYCWYLHA